MTTKSIQEKNLSYLNMIQSYVTVQVSIFSSHLQLKDTTQYIYCVSKHFNTVNHTSSDWTVQDQGYKEGLPHTIKTLYTIIHWSGMSVGCCSEASVVLSSIGDVTAGSKFTSRSRRTVGTGSSPPCGCDGEDGGNIQAAGRCVQLWPVDEVEGGRRRALHPPDWKAMETWCTLQTWREESNTKVHFHTSSCLLPLYL